jgi:hypothetical protein
MPAIGVSRVSFTPAAALPAAPGSTAVTASAPVVAIVVSASAVYSAPSARTSTAPAGTVPLPVSVTLPAA